MTKQMKTNILLFLLLVAIGGLGRLLPHPPNFTPVAAIGLFAGFLFGRAWWALLIAPCAMLLSDTVFGFYDPKIMLVVYGTMACAVLIGSFLLRRGLHPLRLGISSLTISTIFFLSTNLAWWAWSGMYDGSFSGLVSCFGSAIPFFKYTLMGDAFWTTALFGSYVLVNRSLRVPAIQESHAPQMG